MYFQFGQHYSDFTSVSIHNFVFDYVICYFNLFRLYTLQIIKAKKYSKQRFNFQIGHH